MPTQTRTSTPWLFLLMATLTLLGTAAIGAFVAAPSWVMLGFALAAVLAGCGVVLVAIGHELNEDDD